VLEELELDSELREEPLKDELLLLESTNPEVLELELLLKSESQQAYQ